ncbi:PREDICTED: uncharacterized protein LOC107186219 [Dufourea novaeangliae]|uniref:Uncharacterized protein n=1 Tax=Dufourea novaeangliae TaxID=178035 RepID=A0A154P7Y9_DUFNO|nr:PREDICTED: uncharacterized protein LOC107186219 [Dufourea novaeangliae]KZC08046.1 hypothetical protein WN55_09109 [Dufourea novaeangliae]
MPSALVFLLLLTIVGIHSKALDTFIDGSTNKIDGEVRSEGTGVDQDTSASSSNDGTTKKPDGSSTAKPSLLTWFLAPLSQNVQFSPQTFLRDRIVQLKETLNNLGVQGNSEGKQFGNGNGLLQVAGANDAGYYTDRLDPAGFFGGNGWLANKGGILGGPGVILSTGSVLTDYPTPYRKK